MKKRKTKHTHMQFSIYVYSKQQRIGPDKVMKTRKDKVLTDIAGMKMTLFLHRLEAT